MDKRDWYKGQYPTGNEMDELLALTEAEIGLVVKDVRGTKGLLSTAIVAYENAAPDNNVRVPIGAAILDRSGTDTTQTVARWGSIQTVDCSVDSGAATTEPGVAKERYLAVFVKYDETLADARTDYDGNPIDYEHNASFAFEVHQTADADPGVAVPVPDPGDEYVRVCDILVTKAGWGTIVDPVDPENPGDDEIDYTGVNYLETPELVAARLGKRTLLDTIEGGFGGRIQTDVKRQVIINGDFGVQQRFSSAQAANGYVSDRWYQYEDLATGGWIGGAANIALAPPTSKVRTATGYNMDVQTAQAVIAAGERAYLEQMVEGYRYRAVSKQRATLSFWVWTQTFTGTLCVAFQNGASPPTASFVAEFTINAAATWEYKTVEVEFDESIGAWSYGNTIGLRVVFTAAAGSTYQTATPGVWVAGNKIGTTTMGNAFDNVANDIVITQVQLNEGRMDMPFYSRGMKQELALCQRYYEKSYDFGVPPTSAVTPGSFRAFAHGGAGTSVMRQLLRFAVVKRTTPTMTGHSTTGAGAAGKFRNITTGLDVNHGWANQGDASAIAVVSTLNNLDDITGQWTADAELP